MAINGMRCAFPLAALPLIAILVTVPHQGCAVVKAGPETVVERYPLSPEHEQLTHRQEYRAVGLCPTVGQALFLGRDSDCSKLNWFGRYVLIPIVGPLLCVGANALLLLPTWQHLSSGRCDRGAVALTLVGSCECTIDHVTTVETVGKKQ